VIAERTFDAVSYPVGSPHRRMMAFEHDLARRRNVRPWSSSATISVREPRRSPAN
jgi:hypothetical protein